MPFSDYEVKVLFGILAWIFDSLSFFIFSISIGYPIPFFVSCTVIFTTFIIQLVPITPGGWGISESAGTLVLAWIGYDPAIGASLLVIDHFYRMVYAIIFGGISLHTIGFIREKDFIGETREKYNKLHQQTITE